MAEVDLSFSRGFGAEVAAGAAATDAPSNGELGAGATAGGDMARSTCQTAGEASGAAAKSGGGQADQLGR
ncbi:MAG: hypothetical protein ACREIR_12680 [Geminicoccaceae bacterium]